MDSFEDVSVKSTGFIKHVFQFDDMTKSELLNVAQYAILAIVPIVILNKSIQNFIPEVDEDKGSVEILAEIVLQIFILFFGMFFIHRVLTYIPTYSGVPVGQLNMFQFILAFLVIVLSLQTKLGEKVSVLYERVMENWFGYYVGSTGLGKEQQHQRERNIVRVSQPIRGMSQPQPQSQSQSQSQQPSQIQNMQPDRQLHQVDQVANYNTMITQQIQQDATTQQPNMYEQSLGQRGGGGGGGVTGNREPQQNVNFDAMYQEPMAANDALGGYGSFSAF